MVESISSWIQTRNGFDIKIHLGCGSKYLEGWCNVDNFPVSENESHRGTDIKADVWADLLSLELEVDSVDEFLAIHVFEHFYRHELLRLLGNLYAALKPGGILVVEMPDFRRLIQLSAFLPRRPKQVGRKANRDLVKSQFFGAAWEENSDSFPYHKYVWEKTEFADELRSIGFEVLLLTNATKSHQAGRDFACIAKKPSRGPSAYRSKSSEERLRDYGGRLTRFGRQSRNIARISVNGVLGR